MFAAGTHEFQSSVLMSQAKVLFVGHASDPRSQFLEQPTFMGLLFCVISSPQSRGV